MAFRLDPFNLGAPLQWYREICNMKEVTPHKLQRLSRNPEEWNGNMIPQDLFREIFEIAAYDPTSRKQADMEAQKWLYIELFECCKMYDVTRALSARFWENHQSCKHPHE